MHTLADVQLSLFRGATNSQAVQTVTLGTVLDAIQTGAYRIPIERLRHLRMSQGQAAYNAVKVRLDAVTFGGVFAPTRSKTTLVQQSGVAHGDIDHISNVQGLKQALCGEPALVYAFVSPGADGLKVGVRIAPGVDDAAYKHAWQCVAAYFQTHHGVTWDPSGKDVCRLCFVSWDPALYINLSAEVFPIPAVPTSPQHPYAPLSPRMTIPRGRRDAYVQRALDTAVNLIETSTPGNRHQARTKAAYLLGGYVAGGFLTRAEALDALEAAVQRNTAHLQPSLQTIEACLDAGMQEPITLDDLRQTRRQWHAAHWHTRATAWTGQLRTVTPEEAQPWHV
jgi:hypothetical protein